MPGRSSLAVLFCFATVLFATELNAAIVRSVASGSWNNPSNFDCVCIPGGGDEVTIDHAVIVDQTVSALSLTISPGATVEILSGMDLNIRTDVTGPSSGTGRVLGAGNIRFLAGGTALVSGNLVLENSGQKITEKPISFLSGTILFTNSDLEIQGNHSIENFSGSGVTFGPGSRVTGTSTNPIWYQRSGSLLISTNPENIIAGNVTLEAGNDPNTFETRSVSLPDTHFIPEGKFWDLVLLEDHSQVRLTGEIIVTHSLRWDSVNVVLDAGENHPIRMEGDWINGSIASDPFYQREGQVVFEGDSIQLIQSSAIDTFHHLEIFQAAVSFVDFSNSIYVRGTLTMTMGHLRSPTDGAYVALMDTASVAGGSPISYVMAHAADHSSGNFMRKYFQTAETINYPVGNPNHYHPFTFTLHNYTTNGQPYCDIRVSSIETGHPFRPSGPSYSNLFWMVDVGGISTITYDVGMGYDSQFAGDENQMILGRWDGTNWTTYNMANTVFDLLYSSHRITELPIGHDFAGIYGLSLPIELISFEGKKAEAGIELAWRTASESNNDHFELFRSIEGGQFELIGTVNGAGTTNEVSSYQFLDEGALTGIHYYQLKQVDLNGTVEDYGIIEVMVEEGPSTHLKILSNPVTPGNSVQASLYTRDLANSTIRLMDINGNLIWRSNMELYPGDNPFELTGTNNSLGAGIYFLVADTGNQRISDKVVVLR